MSTENQVSNDNLRMLTAVLENAELPLTPERIDQIESSLT
jgi:glutamate dehydrogenase/leucine dehydrogenase